MQVILLERIGRLGQMGDVVTVKDGFARNFLLPQGKALRATKANRERFEKERSQLEARNLELKSEAGGVAEKLQGKSFIIIRQASNPGPALWLGHHARHLGCGHRRRLLHRAPPGHARPADQDTWPARCSHRAPCRGRAACEHQCRPLRPTRLHARHAASR